jgi:hypothetical protein
MEIGERERESEREKKMWEKSESDRESYIPKSGKISVLGRFFTWWDVIHMMSLLAQLQYKNTQKALV